MSNGYKWEILPREGGGVFFDFWDIGIHDIGDTTIEIDAHGTAWRTWYTDEDAERQEREKIDNLGAFLVGWLSDATDKAKRGR